MTKGRLLEDTFEQLVELGASTAKKTVKQIGQTLNPLSIFDQNQNFNESTKQKTEQLKKQPNHTPLNFEELNKKIQNQEKAKQESLRQRLFQMVKEAEKKAIEEEKQKEIQKRREEYAREQEKNQQRQKQQEEAFIIPQGKIRRSIFSPKKVAQRQHIETKASVGKQ